MDEWTNGRMDGPNKSSSTIVRQREAAASKLLGPTDIPGVDKGQMLDDCKSALYAAKICSYAQGMNLIKAMSLEKGWGIDLAECARIWKGGCIIRAAFLDRIRAAYVKVGW